MQSSEPNRIYVVEAKPKVLGDIQSNYSGSFEVIAEPGIAPSEACAQIVRDRDLLHGLLQNSPDAICFKDRELRFTRVNRAFARLLGADDPGDIEGRRVEDFFSESQARRITDEENHLLATGTAISDKLLQFPTQNGAGRWFSVTKAPLHDADNSPAGLVLIARDVTARRQSEHEHRRNEAALRHAERLARIGYRIWRSDRGEIDSCSTTTLNIAGLEGRRDGLSADDWLGRVHPQDRPTVARAYASAHDSRYVRQLSYRLVRDDKSIVHVQELLEPLGGTLESQAPLWFSTVQDITEQRRKEQKLEFLSSVTQAASEAQSYEHAVHLLLVNICNATGWEYGEAWFPDGENLEQLTCHGAWHAARSSARLFHDASRKMRFRKGEGLPGKAWSTGQMQWYPDIHALGKSEFHRLELAEQLDLTGIIMLPVMTISENRFVGVLAFGMFGDHRTDEGLAKIAGEITSQIGACFERLEAIERLRESEQRLRSLADHLPGVIYRWIVRRDGSEEVAYVSSKAQDIFGLETSSNITTQQFWDSVHPDDIQRVREVIDQCIADGSSLNLLYRIRRADSSVRWINVTAAQIQLPNGDRSFDGILLDVTGRIVAEERARYLASHDAGTGLPNRALLMEKLANWLSEASTEHGVTLLHVTIDQLQSIVESSGHEQSQSLVSRLGNRLKRLWSGRHLLALIDGNAFMIALPDARGRRSLESSIMGIHEAIGRPAVIDGQEFQVTASIGIACGPADGGSPERLMRAATIACDRARLDGGDNHNFYSPDMAAAAEKRMSLHSALRRAVAAREFELYYQPIVDAASTRLCGAEALLRWRRQGGAMVSPAEFIPVAEETGLIVTLGSWVIEEAMEKATALHDKGLLPGPIHVNVSARQLARGELIHELREALQRTECSPEWIELELTETSLMGHVEMAFEHLSQFRDMGFRIAVDDFGTGYSSLSYLRELPIDTLKIDRSFVQKMTQDSKSAALVSGIVGIAHGLDMSVIAEGVETEHELTFLRAYRCDALQGYYFHKPLEAGAFEALLHSQRR